MTAADIKALLNKRFPNGEWAAGGQWRRLADNEPCTERTGERTMIETYYRTTIHFEIKTLFCLAERELEEMKNKVLLDPKYKGEEVSEFIGCPAAGPYITGLFTTRRLAEDFEREIKDVLTKFRAKIID
jgi:hypothetical protein